LALRFKASIDIEADSLEINTDSVSLLIMTEPAIFKLWPAMEEYLPSKPHREGSKQASSHLRQIIMLK
jgi:hypothetical protein